MSDLIMDKVALLSLNISKFGNSRKVSVSEIEVEADKSMISVSKRLLDSPQLTAIGTLDSSMRRYVSARSVEDSSGLFKNGIYMIPTKLVLDVETFLAGYKIDREELVEQFIDVYNKQVEESERRLKGIFSDDDYPEVNAIRQAFSVNWQYVQVTPSANLASIDADLFEQQKKIHADKWKQATEEVQKGLRQGMKDLVDYMADKLTPKSDGGKKRFNDGGVKHVYEFLELFDARNVTDDKELAALVEQARELTDGVDVEMLRDDMSMRNAISNGFKEIQESMSGMIETVDHEHRDISFELG